MKPLSSIQFVEKMKIFTYKTSTFIENQLPGRFDNKNLKYKSQCEKLNSKNWIVYVGWTSSLHLRTAKLRCVRARDNVRDVKENLQETVDSSAKLNAFKEWLMRLGHEPCNVEIQESHLSRSGFQALAKTDIEEGSIIVQVPEKALMNCQVINSGIFLVCFMS